MLKRGLVLLCTIGVIIGCDRIRSAATGKPSADKKVTPSDGRNAKIDTLIHQEPKFIDESLLGPKLGPDGKVTSESNSFRRGQPIYLTMVLRESPGGLRTSAVWLDSKDKVVRADQKPMNGAKVATFTLKDARLKPGKYHVIGYWGGNVAADKPFEIVAGPGKRKK